MKTTKKDIKFNGKEKGEIREMILNHAQKGNSFLDLYGNGENYKLAKKRNINILSIDDARDFKNEKKLKIELKGKDKMFISLYDLCNLEIKRKHDVIWLDFCGALNNDVQKTIKCLPNIMENKGIIFFTLLCGRENILPKGTIRKAIDAAIIAVIKQCFKEVKVKTNIIFSRSYLSKPEYDTRKKKGATRMIVHGLTWEKK